jgi:hypothetical protein
MVDFFEPLFLPVDLLVVKTKLLQTLVVKPNNFIQTLFCFTRVKFNLLKLVFSRPGSLLLGLSFSLRCLQIPLSISQVSFQNHQLGLLVFKFTLNSSASILLAFSLSLNLVEIALSLPNRISNLPHFLSQVPRSSLLQVKVVLSVLDLAQ